MKKVFFIASIMGGLSSVTATANDFSGFYLGAKLGYGFAHNEDTDNPGALKIKPKGLVVGIQGGHNWQLDNNLIFGIELGFDANHMAKKLHDKSPNSDPAYWSPYYGKDRIGPSGNVNFKLGYAFEAFYPYVTVGVTVTRNANTVGAYEKKSSTGSSRAAFNNQVHSTAVGPNVGAGILYQFNDDFLAGLEYRYTDLGSRRVYIPDPNYPKAGKREFKTRYGTITAQINYLF